MSVDEQIKKAQVVSDEIDLVNAVLNGYPQSMARSDAQRAMRVIAQSHNTHRDEVLQLKRRIAELESVPPLYAAVEEAAGALPDGWEIRLCVEQGAGTVELFDPDGVESDFATNHERLDFTVKDALDAAQSIHSARQPAPAQEK